MNSLDTLVLILLILGAVVQVWLHIRETMFLRVLNEQGELEEKSISYRIAGLWMTVTSIVVQTVFVTGMIFGGGLSWMQSFWSGQPTPVADALLLLSIVMAWAVVRRIMVGVRIWSVERRFGFSRQTPFLFAKDTLFQGFLLFLVTLGIGGIGIIALEAWGVWGWGALWLVWTVFTLLHTWLYPVLIAPLFNDFNNPNDATLVDEVRQLGDRAGIQVGKVLVMDGSKRSSHGNAHVAGLGATKRVVLLDTLFDFLTREEILSVLAHELGHQKLRHIAKYKMLEAVSGALWIGVFGYTSQFTSIQYAGSGVVLAVFWMLSPLLAFWVLPLFMGLIRTFEYQADSVAVSLGYGDALGSALIKLNNHNAAPPSSEPLYARVYHSHPMLSKRLRALSGETGRVS
jgi:STE24 endopeptidase